MKAFDLNPQVTQRQSELLAAPSDLKTAFDSRTDHPMLQPGFYFTELPFEQMETDEGSSYLQLFRLLMDVVDAYLDRHSMCVPATNISSLMHEIQIECVEPFLANRSRHPLQNEFIQALGSTRNSHGGVTVLGAVLPIALGQRVFNFS